MTAETTIFMGRKSKSTHPIALKRLALGLSATAMAKLLKCSVHTIKSLEAQSGRMNMSPSMAARLAALHHGDIKAAIDLEVDAYRAKLYRATGIQHSRLTPKEATYGVPSAKFYGYWPETLVVEKWPEENCREPQKFDTEIRIERDVSLPRNLAKEKYPLSELNPGESFFVQDTDRASAYSKQCRISCRAKKLGIKITTRSVEGGIRVWRLE